MKNIWIAIIFLSVTVLFVVTGCGTVDVKPNSYFILEYKTIKEDPSLVQKVPFPYTVRVLDTELPKTYDRAQIVVRTSENKISYSYSSLWAEKLSNAVPNLIQNRVVHYHLYSKAFRNFDDKADYEIMSVVNAIEIERHGNRYFAHLNIEFYLKDINTNTYVVQYVKDRHEEYFQDDAEMFVQTVNDVIMSETDHFVTRVIKYMKNRNVPILDNGVRDVTAQTDSTSYEAFPSSEEQVAMVGRLYLPTKTDPDYEPQVDVFNEKEDWIGSYKTGTDIMLDPGDYWIRFGSGAQKQQIVKKVTVLPRYKYVLKPDWGWLVVNLIDENRNQIDNNYEIFDVNTTESYGFGNGIKEGTGQKLRSWVLNPGTYKIVLNHLPYNTYTDFATLEVKQGELEEITIVIDSEDNHLIGAGDLSMENLVYGDTKLRHTIMNHFNANATVDNKTDKGKNDFLVTLNEQLENRVDYDQFPYYFNMRNVLELGVTKESDTEFRFSSDSFDWKNTGVYYFYNFLGIYGRADVNTHFFNEYLYTKEKQNYIKINASGVQDTLNTKKLGVKNSLFPMTTKEGMGINVRPINTSRIDLNLRFGLGLRQDLYDDYYTKDNNASNSSISVYRELSSKYQKGTEISLTGNAQPLSFFSYLINADVLIPFEKGEPTTMDWENDFNFRLFKAISFDYRLNLNYNKDVKDYVMITHTAFLRFTYILAR